MNKFWVSGIFLFLASTCLYLRFMHWCSWFILAFRLVLVLKPCLIASSHSHSWENCKLEKFAKEYERLRLSCQYPRFWGSPFGRLAVVLFECLPKGSEAQRFDISRSLSHLV